MNLSTTKSGLPAVWEAGGGSANTGRAVVICGPAGERRDAKLAKAVAVAIDASPKPHDLPLVKVRMRQPKAAP